MITGMQIRMARAALKWKVDALAEAAGLTWAKVQHLEKSDGVPRADERTLAEIRRVLEEAGVRFEEETPDAEPTVRIRRV